jgi:hypothetical protein
VHACSDAQEKYDLFTSLTIAKGNKLGRTDVNGLNLSFLARMPKVAQTARTPLCNRHRSWWRPAKGRLQVT